MRNTTTTLLAFVPLALFSFLGCGGDSATNHDDEEAHSSEDGHDHEGEGHAEEGDADEHAHAGETHELGSVTAAGTTLSVTITGDVEPGAELHVELEPSGGPAPGSIRLWVGLESGVGSLKAKANHHGEHLDGHVEVPEKLPSNARLWIQVESSTGKVEVRGVDLP